MRKFYILTMIFALLGISQVWANEAASANNSSDIVGGNVVISDEHVTFTLDGVNDFIEGDGGYRVYKDLGKESESPLTLTWTIDSNAKYTIAVTKISFKGRAYNSNAFIAGNGKMVFNGVTTEVGNADLWSHYSDEISSTGNFSSGIQIICKNTSSGLFGGAFDFYIKDIKIEYTITPTVVPSVAEPASTTVPVSISEDRKEVDLSKYFTLPAGTPSDFAIEYQKSGGVISSSNFYAEAAGDFTVKARVAAKENCHEASAWSGNYTITVERRDPVLTLNANEAEVQVNKTVDLSELIAEHVGDALEYAVTSANKDKASLEGAVFTATETGEYTVQIKSKQSDQYNETSKDVTVTVTKVSPEFAQNFTQEEADALLVEGKIANAFTLTNVSKDENLSVNITTLTISDVAKGDAVLAYDKATNTITALNAGTATIQFVQAETAEIGAGSSEVFTFTVSKNENTIYVKGVADFAATIQPDAVLENVVFSANNNDYTNFPISWEAASGEEFAVFDPEAKTITANYKLGTASWTLTQAENYKFKAGEATFSVKVAQAKEATDCYVLENNELVEWSTVGRTQEYEVNGPAAQLKFQARRVALLGFSTNGDFFAEYSTTIGDDEWNRLEPYMDLPETDKWYEFTYDIPENTKRVRMRSQTGAQGYRCIQNVKVTRKGYVRAEDVEIAVFPNEAGEGKLTVDYSLANGGDLKIVCDNDLFTLGQNSIADVDCSSGKVEIPVSFAAQEEQGVYEANVTIYNAVYSKNVKLSAAVRKLDPVITWDDIELVYGDEAALNATIDVTELELQYALVGETDVIRIADGKIFADKAGAAQIKAFVEETDKYNAAQKIIDVTVKKATQTIEWTQELTTLEVGQYLQLEATASSGLEVTFISSDETIAYVDEFNMLHALLEGDVTIKAVQAGNDNVEGTETEEKALTIIPSTDQREEQVIIWENQILEVDMAEGAETVILTAYLESGIDVTYESSDETIAKIGKEQNELELWIDVIVPIRVGKVRITASREGDDTFKPAVPVTKEFEIINSDDPETGLDNIESAKRATKILLNGQIFILRDGKIYDLRGQVVR